MKPIQPLLILALLVLFVQTGHAQERYSTVKIYVPADKTQRAKLIGLLQIDHFQQVESNAIISEISSSEIAKLKTTGYRYEILVEDVARQLQALNKRYYEERANG